MAEILSTIRRVGRALRARRVGVSMFAARTESAPYLGNKGDDFGRRRAH